MASVNLTPENGLDVGDGLELSWSPIDSDGNAITAASANITLTIQEPGATVITKTAGDLGEAVAGTYTYTHKTSVAGVTRGKWVYDGAGNADGVEQFYFVVDKVSV